MGSGNGRLARRSVAFLAALATGVAMLGGVTLGARPVKRAVASLVTRGQPAPAPVPAPAAPADWTTFGGGLGSGFAATGSTLTASNVAGLQQAWYVQADGEVSGNPVEVGGQVFFGTSKGTVYAVAAASGAVQWTQRLDGSPINGGALYDSGMLFIATSGGQVYALDPASGHVIWSSGSLIGSLKDALRASPKAYGGVIYESLGGTDDDANEQGGVVALDENTGRVLWRTMLVQYDGGGAAVFSPPAIIPQLGELVVGTGNPTPFPGNAAADGAVPAGSDPGSDSLIALSLSDGHILWSAQTLAHDATDADFIAGPNLVQLSGGQLAVGDGEKNGSYYLFDARTGQPLWTASLTLPKTDTLVVATSAVAGGRIFAGTMDVPSTASGWPQNYQAPGTGRLVALSAQTGRVLWSDPLPSTIAAAPVAASGVVVAIEANGTLIAVDPATGRILWQAQAPGQIWNAEAALSAAGGTVLVPLANPGGVAAYTLPAPPGAAHD